MHPRVADRRRPLLTAVLLCGLVTHGQADTDTQLEEAATQARAGNFAPAWCIWQVLSEAGNPEAKFHLGWLYRNGHGVAVDEERARSLWEQAAAQGHGEAQMALATLYALKDSAIHDPARAVEWYTAAATQGFDDALLILLTYADEGDPVAADAVAGLIRGGQAGRPVSVTVDAANVRAGPSGEAAVLVTLPVDTRVLRLEVRDPWWRVWTPETGAMGWMHQSLFR